MAVGSFFPCSHFIRPRGESDGSGNTVKDAPRGLTPGATMRAPYVGDRILTGEMRQEPQKGWARSHNPWGPVGKWAASPSGWRCIGLTTPSKVFRRFREKSLSMYAPRVNALKVATSASSPEPGPEAGARSMLDEPSLSRQWVVRRLQRALSMENRHAPLWRGMARRIDAPWDSVVGSSAVASRERARAIAEIIERLGSSPYPTFGFAQPLCSAAGSLLGVLSRRAALFTSRRAASHALAEYVGLAALVDGAEGVPEDLLDAVTPLLATAASEAAVFQD